VVNYGVLAGHLEHFTERPESLLARYTERVGKDPDDADAYHHRAHALAQQNRPAEALDDLSRAIHFRPDDAHLLHLRAQLHARAFRKLEPAIADLEAALVLDPSLSSVRELLATSCNNLAWGLVSAPPSGAGSARALALSARAVELTPGQAVYLNTRGVALYRAGHFAEAVTVLEKSLEAGRGQSDGFDLFFLAMAHHRLGHRAEARRCLAGAVDWTGRASSLSAEHAKELAAFRAEAEAVLAGPVGELPDDVFERPKAGDRNGLG
jgi:tetratricopeptide (TPR) repeat protein